MWVSDGVLARRDFGRRARQVFYRTELPDQWRALLRRPSGERRGFTDTFEEIRLDPPRDPNLAESLRTKIAVVYADGNRFGRARAVVGPETFSNDLTSHRRDLLARILAWFGSAPEPIAAAFRIPDVVEDHDDFRFETLLWGGDEMAFVMPSWLAVDFVEAFFEATAGWRIGGEPLTHAVGVAIGHYKTPIRQLRHVAEEAAELIKAAVPSEASPTNSVTYEIFESLAVPDVPLGIYRAGLFGTATEWEAQKDLARRISFDGARHAVLTRALGEMKGYGDREEFPRSQLYAALRTLRRRSQSYLSDDADTTVTERIATWAERSGQNPDAVFGRLCLAGEVPQRQDPEERVPGIALDIALLVQLWDYVHPLAERAASFPERRAEP